MCQTIAEMHIRCPEHTQAPYVWAFHQFQQYPFHKSRFTSLYLAAREYACTVDGQQHITNDINTLISQGNQKLADALMTAVHFGIKHLREQQVFLDVRLSSLHREVTRLWAKVAQSNDDLFNQYLLVCSQEMDRTPQQLLSLVRDIADPKVSITAEHPAALRYISWDKTPPIGTPLAPGELTIMYHLETLSAHARNNKRLVAELPDPEGGVWYEYELPTGKRISYNPLRRELLLPDIHTDGVPRQFRDVSESLAFALTSARRPGLLVAAAFFPAMTGSLENKEAHEFAFAFHLSNNVFPLSAAITGPVPERILPDPVRNALAQGLN